MAKIVVKMTGHGRGTVQVNGQELEFVRGVSFLASVGQRNRLLLELVADEVVIESEDTEVDWEQVAKSRAISLERDLPKANTKNNNRGRL